MEKCSLGCTQWNHLTSRKVMILNLINASYSRTTQVPHNIRVKTGVGEVVKLLGPFRVLHIFNPLSQFEHSPVELLNLSLIPSSVGERKAHSLNSYRPYGLMPLRRRHTLECFRTSDVGIFFQECHNASQVASRVLFH